MKTIRAIVLHNKPVFTLRRVRINQGGYDDSGKYWGIGKPLYEYDCESLDAGGYIRAYDREDAKAQVRAKYPNATFYR